MLNMPAPSLNALRSRMLRAQMRGCLVRLSSGQHRHAWTPTLTCAASPCSYIVSIGSDDDTSSPMQLSACTYHRHLQGLSAAPLMRTSPARRAGLLHACHNLRPVHASSPLVEQQQSQGVVHLPHARHTLHASGRRMGLCHAASSEQSDGSGKEGGKGANSGAAITLPTMLTLMRVAAIPVLVAGWYYPSPWSTPFCTSIFLLAAFTDWLDGYLARKLNQYSAFGAFLDPVADKLMVAAVLILLCTQPLSAGPLAGNAWLLPAMTLVIIGREITMSALREWAATLGPEARKAVAVSAWGKWKTASQMASLTLLLALKDGGSGPWVEAAAVAGPMLLCVAAYLTLWSLILYLKGLWKYLV